LSTKSASTVASGSTTAAARCIAFVSTLEPKMGTSADL
jgi:hypothetical protein